MKLISLIAFAVVVAVARAATPDQEAPIIKQDMEVNPDGSYVSDFETGNGIIMHEQGQLKNAGVENEEAEEVHGEFSYTSPEGKVIHLTYVANEQGFQPSGDHLPGVHHL